jgi:lipopolysaccharide biosynthesis glycosyltransferase
MIPDDFFEENKRKINGFCKKYKKCKIIFINMGKKYKDWKTGYYFSESVYYRLSLSDFVTNFDKIIYLDCDTMVHNDLTDFYNIKMGDKYYMGFPGHEVGYLEINGTRNFINSGVMLINLKSLRRINASLLFDNYYNTYGTKKVDEYLINVIFYNKISFLPFKYGIPDFEKGQHIADSPSFFWKTLKGHSNGTEEEMISASNNRTITHGAYRVDKWWKRRYNSLSEIGKKWIYYASKSNVFNEICHTYIQYQAICSKLK